MLLDTTVLIDLIRHDAAAIRRLQAIDRDKIQCFVTTATVHELFVGVALGDDSASERVRVKQSLIDKTVLLLDSRTAEQSGLLDGTLRKQRKNIGTIDCINAATAAAHDMPLLTRNVKHFEGIPGLQIETY